MDTAQEIREIVNKETKAWDTQNVDHLLSIMHPDMVWPWPRTSHSHDPIDWVMGLGRFNYERWKKEWSDLFANHTLMHNHREIKKIAISPEKDGAFAVVDIDTLWKHYSGTPNHWKGRTCKVYTKMPTGWKMIMQTGVLEYS